MKNLLYIPMAMLLVSCLTGVTLAAGEKAAGSSGGDQGSGKEKRYVATIAADGVHRVDIVGGEYYYDPNYIVVKLNRPVELTFKKTTGYVPHNLIVKAPEAGINFNVDLKGETQMVKFTPSKIGKYPMYCDKSLLWFKTHREKGMEGVIEVVESWHSPCSAES